MNFILAFDFITTKCGCNSVIPVHQTNEFTQNLVKSLGVHGHLLLHCLHLEISYPQNVCPRISLILHHYYKLVVGLLFKIPFIHNKYALVINNLLDFFLKCGNWKMVVQELSFPPLSFKLKKIGTKRKVRQNLLEFNH